MPERVPSPAARNVSDFIIGALCFPIVVPLCLLALPFRAVTEIGRGMRVWAEKQKASAAPQTGPRLVRPGDTAE